MIKRLLLMVTRLVSMFKFMLDRTTYVLTVNNKGLEYNDKLRLVH